MLERQDGYRYDGNWQNGLIHGEGEETQPNGEMFDGAFAEGKKHGHGTLVTTDGRRINC